MSQRITPGQIAMGTAKLLGRTAAGTGAVEELTAGQASALLIASWAKAPVSYATTADLGSSTSTATTITGYDDTGTVTGDLTSASTTVSNVSAADIAKLKVGAAVTGTNIPASTTISSIAASSFVMNNAASATAAATVITYTQTISALSVDGASPTVGTRVLVKSETAAARNGIYSVTATGSTTEPWVLTRATDADTSAELANAQVAVDLGTANAGTTWRTTFLSTGTIGTTAVSWQALPLLNTSNTWSNTQTVLNLVLTDTTAASLSTSGALTIGATNSANLTVDPNEIQARSNGSAAALFVQRSGGSTNLGGALYFSGNLSIEGSNFLVSGANYSGYNLTVSGGRAVGSGTPGNLVLQTSDGVNQGSGVYQSDIAHLTLNASGMVAGSKLATVASTGTRAGLNVPHGTAPTSPTNGDVWTTTAGMYAQINGAIVGPFNNGATTFQGLTDAVDYVAGDANKVVKVNSGGTGLDFGAVLGTAASAATTDFAAAAHVGSGGTAHSNAVAGGAAGFMTGTDKTKLDGIATGASATFQGLTDAVDYVAGDANKVVKVNGAGTGLDYGAVLGTAASQNTGTSGSTIPLLNAANTWGAAQTFQLASAGAVATPAIVENTGTTASTAASLSLRVNAGERGYVSSTFDGTNYKTTVNATNSVALNVGTTDVVTVSSTGIASTGTVTGTNIVRGFAGYCSGKPAASEKVGGAVAPYAFTITQANCSAKASVAATASTTFDIKNNGTSIGTVAFAASATLGTFSITTAAVASGDLLTIEGPATPDSTLADIAFLVRA